MNCNCHSYNWQTWETKEVILEMLEGILPDGTKKYKKVSIDYCISDTIKYLWDNWVSTGSSCCGHGRTSPHIVFSSVEDAIKGKELIKQIDSRYYELSYWVKALI